MGKKGVEYERTGALMSLVAEAFYKCDLPRSAVRKLIANPQLLTHLLKITILNTARNVVIPQQPYKLCGELAEKKDLDILIERIGESFPHKDLSREAVDFLMDEPIRLPDLVQRMVIKAGKMRSDFEDAGELSRILPNFAALSLQRIERMAEKIELGENEVECEEFKIGHIVSGFKAKIFLAKIGKHPANLRSAGKYLKEHPYACRDRTIVILGAQGRMEKDGPLLVPIFTWEARPAVNLWPIESKFSGEICYLVESQKQK